jgi:hypothetical protein
MKTLRNLFPMKTWSIVTNVVLLAALSVSLMFSFKKEAPPAPAPVSPAPAPVWNQPVSYKNATDWITTYRNNYKGSLATEIILYRPDSILHYLKSKLSKIEKRLNKGPLPPNTVWMLGQYMAQDANGHLNVLIIPTLEDTVTGKVYDFMGSGEAYPAFKRATAHALTAHVATSPTDSVAYDDGHVWP